MRMKLLAFKWRSKKIWINPVAVMSVTARDWKDEAGAAVLHLFGGIEHTVDASAGDAVDLILAAANADD